MILAMPGRSTKEASSSSGPPRLSRGGRGGTSGKVTTLTREEIEAVGRTYDELQRDRLRPPVRNLARRAMRIVAKAGDALGRSVPSDGSRLELAEELSAGALERLFSNETCALHVPGFATPDVCEVISGWMVETFRFHKWEEASSGGATDQTDMYYGVGLPVNAMGESRERCLAYFAEALPAIRKIRDAAAGRLSPIDRLRLELDELWPEGANVRRDPVFGRKMLVGLGRLMKPDGMVGDRTKTDGIIHVDASTRLSRDHGLFSAILYLHVPDSGGELDVWPIAPSALEAPMLAGYLDHAFDPETREATQAVLRRRLPPPVTVAVKPGDLVLINVGRPHAVRGFASGYRAALQTFVDFRRGRALELFA